MPNMVAYLDWTPVFEWRLIRCGSKDGHLEDMYIKEIKVWVLVGPTWSLYGSGTFDLKKIIEATGKLIKFPDCC